VKINVQYEEIAEFYNQQYLPTQKNLNLTPRSLVEMAPLIEEHLRKTKTEQSLSSWIAEIKSSYRIETMLTKEGE
jgi:hypothetical protein